MVTFYIATVGLVVELVVQWIRILLHKIEFVFLYQPRDTELLLPVRYRAQPSSTCELVGELPFAVRTVSGVAEVCQSRLDNQTLY